MATTSSVPPKQHDYVENLKNSIPLPEISDSYSDQELEALRAEEQKKALLLDASQGMVAETLVLGNSLEKEFVPPAGIALVARSANPIDSFLNMVPLPPEPDTPPAEPTLVKDGPVTYSGTDAWITKKFHAGKVAFEIAALAPNSDTIWVGSIVTGGSVSGGVLTPIALPRGRGEITLLNPAINPGTTATTSASLSQPSLESVNTAVGRMLSKFFPNGVPAFAGAIVIQTYHSLDEAAMHLNASGSWIGGNARNVLDTTSSKSQSHMVISIIQAYYDVVFAPPEMPSSVFKSSFFGGVSLKDVQDALGPHPLKPAYVSTVRYGRMLLLHASSDASESELKDALHLAVNGLVGSAELDASLKQNEAVRQTQFAMVVLGSQDHTATLIEGFAGLQHAAEVFKSGQTLKSGQPAYPISYQLRWLGRDPKSGELNKSAKMTFTTDYDAVQKRAQQVVRFGARFSTTDDDKDGGDRVDIDLFDGNVLLSTYACDQPYNHKWDDHTSQPDARDADFGGMPGWYSTNSFTRPVWSNEIKNLRLRVRKTGDKGWHFKVSGQLWLESGTPIEFVQFGAETKFGGSNQAKMFP